MSVNHLTINVDYKILDGWIEDNIEYAIVECIIADNEPTLYLFSIEK